MRVFCIVLVDGCCLNRLSKFYMNSRVKKKEEYKQSMQLLGQIHESIIGHLIIRRRFPINSTDLEKTESKRISEN